MKTVDTINYTVKAIDAKICHDIIVVALMAEGFCKPKAELIIRWATQTINKDKYGT